MSHLLNQIPPDAITIDFIEASQGQPPRDGWTHSKTVPYCIAVIPCRGHYEIRTQGTDLTIGTDELFLSPPNQPITFIHRTDPPRTGVMKMKWIHFRFTVFGTIDFTSLLEMPLRLDKVTTAEFADTIDAFLRLKQEETGIFGLARRSSLGFQLLELVCNVSEIRKDGIDVLEQSRRLRPVLDFMNRHLSGKTDVTRLARTVGLSPSRFHSVFKKTMGTGPMEYLRKLRLSEAFRIVMASDEKLQMIAEKTGFCNEFHLSREFRRQFGKSPREYRKKEFRNQV